MHAAVDVGVVPLVVAGQRVQDLAGFLRGGGVVEVDDPLPVMNQAVQDREVLTDRVGVQKARRYGCHAIAPPFT